MELKRAIPFALLVLLASCGKDQWDDCITSTGAVRQEERTVEGFHTVVLTDRVDLVLEHRAGNSVGVETGLNLIGQVGTEVRDSVLHVSNNNRCNWVRSFKPRIIVKVPIDAVRKLELSGTGNVSATDTIRRNSFFILQHGAEGSVVLPVAVDELIVSLHTGSGDVTVTGRCNANAYLFSGIMSPIDASGMRCWNMNVNNSGVSDIRCEADGHLDVGINGIGDVYYGGSPNGITTNGTGSGQLIRVD